LRFAPLFPGSVARSVPVLKRQKSCGDSRGGCSIVGHGRLA
jgi:hypothetical protein